MSPRNSAILLVAACLLVVTNLLVAQAPRPEPLQDEGEIPVFHSDTARVLLHVSVIDKAGKMITTVPQSAFKITENGVEQQIRFFRREDVPVSMGLIIDNSGSMRNKIQRVNAAALTLVKESNPQDEVFIYNFNDDVYPDQEFTNDIKKLQLALQKVDSRGGTAMRNAVSMGIDYARKGKKDKKVLVVITDGNDTASTETSFEQLMFKAQRSEVVIYSIGLLAEEEPGEARAARRALKALANASGGLDYYPKNLTEVEAITPQIAQEIRNQYLIEYASTNQTLDGTFRQIKVTVNNPKGASVRTRNGYWATKK